MGIKIGDIVRQCGIPASTIRYYVSEGLLKAPEKVSKKMGFYDESCIERLMTIQKLQEKRFSLSSIRNILNRVDEGISLDEAEAVEDLVFGHSPGGAEKLLDREAFLKITGLLPSELAEVEEIGLIMPLTSEKGRPLYDQEDITMAKGVIKKMFQLKVQPREIEFYLTFGRQITEHELALRKRLIRNASVKENFRLTMELTNAANLSRGYILRRLFQKQVQENINSRRAKAEAGNKNNIKRP